MITVLFSSFDMYNTSSAKWLRLFRHADPELALQCATSMGHQASRQMPINFIRTILVYVVDFSLVAGLNYKKTAIVLRY